MLPCYTEFRKLIKMHEPCSMLICNNNRKFSMISMLESSRGSWLRGQQGCRDPSPRLSLINSQLQGAVQSSEVIYARFLSTVSGSTALGGSAEFYCAGIGKPPPTISWTQVCCYCQCTQCNVGICTQCNVYVVGMYIVHSAISMCTVQYIGS